MSKTQRSAAHIVLASSLATGAIAGASVLVDEMRTDYGEGAKYSVSMQTSATTTSEREMLVDGERREGRGGFGGGSERTTSFSVAYTDEVVAADEGAPTKVRRAFEAASGGMEMEMRGEPVEIDLGSPFDGVTLMLSLEEGVVEATVEDGDAPDDTERLEGHALPLPLDGLLPSGEVAAGDSWDIEPDALKRALGAGLSAKLLDRPEFGGRGGGRGGEGRGGRQRGGPRGGGMADAVSGLFRETMEWEVTGTLTDRTEEVEGRTCAVIEIEASMSGELPERQFGRGRDRDRAAGPAAPAGRTALPEGTIEAELEGELLWDAANACPVRLTLTGEIESEDRMVRDTERGTFEINSSSETELEVTVSITPTKAD